jgi:hypothetical protein
MENFYTHLQSQLRYGIILWVGTKKRMKILRIQKKVIRLITGLKRKESCRQTFNTFRPHRVYILRGL